MVVDETILDSELYDLFVVVETALHLQGIAWKSVLAVAKLLILSANPLPRSVVHKTT